MRTSYVGLVMMLVGCATPSPRSELVLAVRSGPSKTMPGARYRVVVGADQQLSGEYRVSSGGTIDFPLCGAVKVLGLATQEIEAQLTQCLLPSLREMLTLSSSCGARTCTVMKRAPSPRPSPEGRGRPSLGAVAHALRRIGRARHRSRHSASASRLILTEASPAHACGSGRSGGLGLHRA